jgi:single-strand DNA-binding protein
VYNQVILIGNLGKDPEIRTIPGGTMIASFSLATKESWKDKQGAKKEETTWHNCQAWGKLAEIIQQYVFKGSLIMVEGSIRNESWEDKDGEKKYRTVIRVNNMKMLGGKKEDRQPRQDDTGYPGPNDDRGW